MTANEVISDSIEDLDKLTGTIIKSIEIRQRKKAAQLGRFIIHFNSAVSVRINSLEYTQDNRKFDSIARKLLNKKISKVKINTDNNLEFYIDSTTSIIISLISGFTKNYAIEVSDLNETYPTTRHFSRPPQPSKLERELSNPRITGLTAIKMLRDGINEIPELEKNKPDPFNAASKFFSRIEYAFGLALKEKEIFVFVFLQWIVIILGYYLWVQMIDWIPQETWERAARDEDVTQANILLSLWTFLIVGLVSYPLGILSACIASVHFLTKQHQESTVGACLKLALPSSFSLWILHWVDGWYTVIRVIDRLPRKNSPPYSVTAAREALYYAWKIAISGLLPSITLGSGLIQGAKNSLVFVKDNLKEVALLRIGYSMTCWIAGILSYILTVLFFAFTDVLSEFTEMTEGIYTFYLWAGIPAAVGVGIVLVILRPIYLISLCDLYSDHIDKLGPQEDLVISKPDNKTNTSFRFWSFSDFKSKVYEDNTAKLLKYASWIFFSVMIIVSIYQVFGDKFYVLNASSGKDKYLELGKSTKSYSADGEIEIIIEEININKPTSGCLGFYNAEDKNSSFQFCVLRATRKQQYYSVGYRVLSNGIQSQFNQIIDINLDEIASFTVNINEGEINISVNGKHVNKVDTNFNAVIPFISATSGQVRFKF